VKVLRTLFSASLLFTMTVAISAVSTTPASAEGPNQVSAHIDWSGIGLSPSGFLAQTITPHNVPSISSGQVDWSINIGNTENSIWVRFTLSNSGRAEFGFFDVPAGSRVQSDESANCSLTAGNAFQRANTWRSTCFVPLMPVAGETYNFSVKPLLINGSQWWAGNVSIGSTGKVISLGRLENNPSAAALAGGLNMRGFDQITFWKETLPPCSAIPDFSATYGALKSGESTQPTLTGTRTSGNCPGLSGVDVFTPGQYRVNIGNKSLSGNTQNSGAVTIPGALFGSYYGPDIKPSSGGSPITQFCNPGSVLTQINVTPQTSSPFLQGFRFGCSAVNADGTLSGDIEIHQIVNQGVSESNYVIQRCSQGQAATAINAATASYVRDLSIRCGGVKPFSVGVTPPSGVSSRLPINSFSQCNDSTNRTDFITGISAYAAAGLDALQAICTPLSSVVNAIGQKPVQLKPEKPSFSFVNFVGNKVNINVSIGSSINKPDSIYLVSPKLGITEAKRVLGKISGSVATWSIDFDSLFSGELVPLKIVSVKNGIESDSLVENFQVPDLSNVSLNNAVPWAPKNVTSRVIGTSGVVTAIATLKAGALAKRAFLFGSSLGISASKAIQGEIIGTKVLFEIPIKTSMAGKTLPFTVFFENEAGKSPPATSKISIPGIPGVAAGGIRIPEPKAVPNTVFCTKGTISRTFAAKVCPPGWKKQ
jgi:hypothetical protein